MKLSEYLLNKQNQNALIPIQRMICQNCNQTEKGCFCHLLKEIDVHINFVILIHPIEAKRRIATGRLSHLCLKGSYLIEGHDYSQNKLVTELVNDTEYNSMMLYPGNYSKNISDISESEKMNVFRTDKKLRLFVIDGTWATARKMTRLSQNLKKLPRICFSPKKESNFRVRKQPGKNCYSTVEAIHHTIELLGHSQGFNITDRKHDHLITVFNQMVENQIGFIKEAQQNPNIQTYRKESQNKIHFIEEKSA